MPCGPRYSQMGPDVPLRAPIKTEWSDNKGEVGGPFRSFQRPFTTHTRVWVWWWMMSQRSKVACRAAESRVRAGSRSRSREFKCMCDFAVVEGLESISTNKKESYLVQLLIRYVLYIWYEYELKAWKRRHIYLHTQSFCIYHTAMGFCRRIPHLQLAVL